MSRMAVVLVSATLTLVTVLGGWWVLRPPAGDRLNVIVVVWDTARADRLSVYGAERPTTPWLAEAAGDAVVFEQAHSPAIWTLPAHASMFTGLPPETTGADERWLWLDERHHTLAEHFAARGYATFAMAANTLLCDETNLLQGFRVRWTTWDEQHRRAARALTRAKLIEGDRSQELAPGWTRPEHGARNAEWGRARYKEAAPLIGRRLLDWIDNRRDPEAPFLAYLNLMEAHTPRLPSMSSRRAVLGDDELIERGLQTEAGHIQLHFYNFGHHEYSDAEIEAIAGVYDATLRDLDQATMHLFEGLEARGLLDETVIVLTSDHGENLGDHGLFNHRFALWESLTHVPLVVWHPELPPERRAEPVSTRDLFPTVARLAGLDAPEGLGDWWTAPSEVATWLAKPLRREIQAVKDVHPSVEIEPWLRSGHALVRWPHKLVALSDGTREVYDLKADPGELEPRGPEADREREALVTALEAYRQAVAPYDPALRTEADDPAHVRASQAELREHLEALGYVVGEDDGG